MDQQMGVHNLSWNAMDAFENVTVHLTIFSREPQLYKRVCPSIGPLVGRLSVSVGWSVRWSVCL